MLRPLNRFSRSSSHGCTSSCTSGASSRYSVARSALSHIISSPALSLDSLPDCLVVLRLLPSLALGLASGITERAWSPCSAMHSRFSVSSFTFSTSKPGGLAGPEGAEEEEAVAASRARLLRGFTLCVGCSLSDRLVCISRWIGGAECLGNRALSPGVCIGGCGASWTALRRFITDGPVCNTLRRLFNRWDVEITAGMWR